MTLARSDVSFFGNHSPDNKGSFRMFFFHFAQCGHNVFLKQGVINTIAALVSEACVVCQLVWHPRDSSTVSEIIQISHFARGAGSSVTVQQPCVYTHCVYLRETVALD